MQNTKHKKTKTQNAKYRMSVKDTKYKNTTLSLTGAFNTFQSHWK